ncbi:MAG TPA: GAP family protein [Candidatus Saccharimonadales bacterium]
MSLASILTIAGIALLDSINPSAILVTLILLKKERYPAKILAYASGIFAAYFGLGVLLILGADTVLGIAITPTARTAFKFTELVVGFALLGYAVFARPKNGSYALKHVGDLTAAPKLFGLGVLVTVVESSTALPYIGAIGIITFANVSAIEQLLILFAYNLLFIAPPLLIMLFYRLWHKNATTKIASWQNRLASQDRNVWPWIVGAIGFLITRDAIAYLVVHFQIVKISG